MKPIDIKLHPDKATRNKKRIGRALKLCLGLSMLPMLLSTQTASAALITDGAVCVVNTDSNNVLVVRRPSPGGRMGINIIDDTLASRYVGFSDGTERIEFFDTFPPDATPNNTGALNPYTTPLYARYAQQSSGDYCVYSFDTDGAGLRSNFVAELEDVTPPIITIPADFTIEATAADTPLDEADYGGPATATDDRDPPNPVTVSSDAPATFPLGNTFITWIASDGAGNLVLGFQSVTLEDTTPPDLTVPADYSTEATAPDTPLDESVYGPATATDLVDPDPEVTSNAPAVFPVGDTIVTWTATDASGNAVSGEQLVTIEDTTDPTIEAPADIIMESTGTFTTVNLGTAIASDIADPAPVITNDAPVQFELGVTTVTWTATDESGNTDTDTQTVTIEPCTIKGDLICINQNVQPQSYCDRITITGAGSFVIPTIFGSSEAISRSSDLYDLIQRECRIGPD